MAVEPRITTRNLGIFDCLGNWSLNEWKFLRTGTLVWEVSSTSSRNRVSSIIDLRQMTTSRFLPDRTLETVDF